MFRLSVRLLLISMPLWGSAQDTLSDIDGNKYPVVRIGPQQWMAENLRVKRFQNGDPIPLFQNDLKWNLTYEEETPAYCQYEGSLTTLPRPGLLYNGYAVVDPRGLCPKGWRVPSKKDWEQLLIHVSGTTEPDAVDTLANYKLKSRQGWGYAEIMADMNYNGSNESGFNARPAGFRDEMGFKGEHLDAYFWSDTEDPQTEQLYSFTINIRYVILMAMWRKRSGMNVRCTRIDNN